MIRRLAAAGAAIVIGGALVPAGTAQAAEHPVLPAEPWQAWDTGTAAGEDGWTEDAPQTASGLSYVADPWTAVLEWQDGDPASNLGTSIETPDLGLEVADGTEVAFRYTLESGAECSGGAPRVFVDVGGTIVNTFDHGDQCGTGGQVSMTIPTGGTVGYAGLVYDNSVAGKVVITDLTIGGRPVLFGEVCEWDDTIGADHPDCVDPAADEPDDTEGADKDGDKDGHQDGDEDGAGDGGEDSTEPTGNTGGTTETGDEDELPVTGSPLPLLAGAGLLLVGGGGAMLLARRRGIV